MHHPDLYEFVFLAMLFACFLIRTPLDIRNRRIKAVDRREGASGRLILLLVFTGSATMPILYFLTRWFDFADYARPDAVGLAGIVLAVTGTFLFWKSHHDLGRQFSPTLEMKESHTLVSTGIYSRIRHPMYTALFAVAAAQTCLIPNAVVGPAFLITFALLYVTRIEHEEKMMLDHFGAPYAEYLLRTNRLLPPLFR